MHLEGFHAVKHALRFAPALVREVAVADRAAAVALAADLAPDVGPWLADAVVRPVAHHTGVEAVARRPAPDACVLRARTSPLVVLDAPRSGGNAGAVVRVAAAAGASGVALSGGTLDPWGADVLRGSAGLHYALPVLGGVGPTDVRGPVVVLDAGGEDVPLPAGAVLVVGSERHGLSPAWRDRADAVLSLPMREGVSSLNLATAVAAALYRSSGRPPSSRSSAAPVRPVSSISDIGGSAT